MSNTLLWYTTRGAGAVSLLLLSGVLVLGVLGTARFEAPGWPRFLTTAFHRNLSLIAIAFLALHVITAVVDPFTSLGWVAALIPFGSYYRTFWLGLGTIAAELLVAVLVTSLFRGLIGGRAWRLVHWLSYAAWPIAVAHGIGTGTDTGSSWMTAIDIACVGAVVTAAAARVLMPAPDPLTHERTRFRVTVKREL